MTRSSVYVFGRAMGHQASCSVASSGGYREQKWEITRVQFLLALTARYPRALAIRFDHPPLCLHDPVASPSNEPRRRGSAGAHRRIGGDSVLSRNVTLPHAADRARRLWYGFRSGPSSTRSAPCATTSTRTLNRTGTTRYIRASARSCQRPRTGSTWAISPRAVRPCRRRRSTTRSRTAATTARTPVTRPERRPELGWGPSRPIARPAAPPERRRHGAGPPSPAMATLVIRREVEPLPPTGRAANVVPPSPPAISELF